MPLLSLLIVTWTLANTQQQLVSKVPKQEQGSHLQIDEEDAEERAELRRKQIEAANKMLYDDTDRPKAFHSKLLLSDVMQERVVQMDYAKQIKSLKRAQDDAFLVQQAARLKVGRHLTSATTYLHSKRLTWETQPPK